VLQVEAPLIRPNGARAYNAVSKSISKGMHMEPSATVGGGLKHSVISPDNGWRPLPHPLISSPNRVRTTAEDIELEPTIHGDAGFSVLGLLRNEARMVIEEAFSDQRS